MTDLQVVNDPDLTFSLLDADGRPSLPVEDEGADASASLSLRMLNRTAHALRFEGGTGATVPGEPYYHFALSFRPGILSTGTLDMLAREDAAARLLGEEVARRWSLTCITPKPGAPTTIYFLCRAPDDAADWWVRREGEDGASMPPLVLSGLCAAAGLEGRVTRVQVKTWGLTIASAGQRYPVDMIRRLAISHGRLAGTGVGGQTMPLELLLPVPAVPSNERFVCHIRNMSPVATVARGPLHLSVRLAGPDDPFALCTREYRTQDAMLAARLGESGWTVVTARSVGQQDAPNALSWPIELPEGGLAPLEALEFQMRLPSDRNAPLDIFLDYDLPGFGSGRRVFTFPRAMTDPKVRQLEDRVRDLESALGAQADSMAGALEGLTLVGGRISHTSLKVPEHSPDGLIGISMILARPPQDEPGFANQPLIHRLAFDTDVDWHGAGNDSNDFQLPFTYRPARRAEGETHFYHAARPHDGAGPLLATIRVGESRLMLAAHFGPGDTMFPMRLTDLRGPYLSEAARDQAIRNG